MQSQGVHPFGGFMGTVDGVSGWIRSQPGFMSYDLSYSTEEHRWVFAAWWQTNLHAEAATAPVTA